MSNRRNRPPNRWGCKPTEDVCVAHDMPLECKHGCRAAVVHSCKQRADAFADRIEAKREAERSAAVNERGDSK